MKQKLLIIVNPKSGVNRQKRIAAIAKNNIDTSLFDYDVVNTEYAGHSIKLATEAIKNGYNIIAIAGGDGSVNEVAQVLVNTPTILAIIPMGSGNGLARHLKIPLKPAKALQLINQMYTTTIDTATINGKVFVSNSGLGFVSSVVDTFSLDKGRGFFGYSVHTLWNYVKYISSSYSVKVSNQGIIRGKFFMLNICNTNQFGYEARIAPTASLTDGMLDIVMIKEAPFYKFPYLLTLMFTGTIKANDNIIMLRSSKVNIDIEGKSTVQLDGEPLGSAQNITAEIVPLSLKVIVPGNVK